MKMHLFFIFQLKTRNSFTVKDLLLPPSE